MATILKSQH